MSAATGNVLTAIICLLPVLVAGRLGMTATDLTESNFDSFVSQQERLIVDFYDPSDSQWQENQKALDKALVIVRQASNSRVPFAKVDASKETALAAKYVQNGRYPQLVWFAHGKPTQYHRTLRDSEMIAQFVMALDRPSVTTVESMESVQDYNFAVLIELPKKSSLFKTVEAVALRHMDQVAFLHIESSSDSIAFYQDGQMGGQYHQSVMHEGQHDVDALDRWLRHQLPLKSEEIPEGDLSMEDGIQAVVGKNFEDIVLQKDKDVMLLVHAPWCGHCKTLRPKWRQFAQAVADVPHLLVAQMDGDRNQSPLPNDFQWQAFPTIFYVKAGETSPLIYRGNRTVESLIEFAQNHSSQPLTMGQYNATDAIYDL